MHHEAYKSLGLVPVLEVNVVVKVSLMQDGIPFFAWRENAIVRRVGVHQGTELNSFSALVGFNSFNLRNTLTNSVI